MLNDRKYYRIHRTFVKRSLRPAEWQISPAKGIVHVPRQGREKFLNEAAAMEFVADNTNVPIPKLHCSFEDDGAVYLIMKYVEGVTMDEISDEQRNIVQQELLAHIQTLHNLHSRSIGGPSGLVVPSHRVAVLSPRDEWKLKEPEPEELVFCHNDLSQQNVILHAESLKILAILDWEYAGFYPCYFDRPFLERLGLSVALDGEVDDREAA
jgi:aminoglycoside phosphotransferase (APT) family kinase protein